jgi:hypothetical protein
MSIPKIPRIIPQTLHINDWPEDASWQRRRKETDASYMAFMLFLSLPIMDRMLKNAYDLDGGPESGLSPNFGTWRNWSSRFHWMERALDYERWRNEVHMIDQANKADEENRRWAEIREKERDNTLDIGRALIEKAKAMLAFPLAEVERVTQVDADGRAREVQIFKPGAWRFGDVARMVDVGTKLVRLAAEMDTERHTVDMRIIWQEAEELAQKHGLDKRDILAMADRIVEERYGGGASPFGPFDDASE